MREKHFFSSAVHSHCTFKILYYIGNLFPCFTLVFPKVNDKKFSYLKSENVAGNCKKRQCKWRNMMLLLNWIFKKTKFQTVLPQDSSLPAQKSTEKNYYQLETINTVTSDMLLPVSSRIFPSTFGVEV